MKLNRTERTNFPNNMDKKYYREISDDYGRKLGLEKFDLLTYAASIDDVQSWADLLLYVRSCGRFLTMVSSAQDFNNIYNKSTYAATTLTKQIGTILRKQDRNFRLKVVREVDTTEASHPQRFEFTFGQ